MPQLNVAPRLVIYLETRLLQRPQNLPRFEYWKTRRHLRRQRDSQLFLASALFIRDAFSILSQPFDMAANGVASHLARLDQRTAIGDESRKQRNGDLIARPGRILRAANFAAIPPQNFYPCQGLKNNREGIFPCRNALRCLFPECNS